MTTLQSALDSAKRGWPVFPAVPNRKNPLIKDWQSRATTDPKTIKRWWDKFPDANVGVLTGSGSGIIVLDVDPRNKGDQSWKAVEAEVGQVDTFKVKTGGNGTHYYFLEPDGDGLRCATNLWPGIDLKAEGGFVVGPGSVHENGQPYQLILPVVDPAPMSDELLQLVRKARSKAKGGQKSAKKIEVGERNSYLFKAGCRMRRQGAEHDEILDALLILKGTRCVQPLSPDEVAQVSSSASKYKPKQKKRDRLILSTPEPWDAPVDGLRLANKIRALILRYIVLSEEAATAIALWIIHVYCLDSIDISPILGVNSPVKRCAKTLLLELLLMLSLRPLAASSITAAAFFRSIQRFRPTLLVDEAETYLKRSDELRGIINSSHRKSSAYVVRAVKAGNDYIPRVFSTWAAKSVALIGELPATLQDRSVPIRLRRKRSDEHVERLRRKAVQPETERLRRQITRWVEDNADAIGKADPAVPEELDDRQRDNSRPLLAIADLIGGDWPQQAREAFLHLYATVDEAENSHGVQLLSDLRDLFESEAVDKLPTADIIAELSRQEDKPWGNWKDGGKSIKGQQIASLLRPFGIKPRQLNLQGRNCRGYLREDFADAWSRYLPSPPQAQVIDPLESSNDAGSDSTDGMLDSSSPSTLENDGNPGQQGIQAPQADQRPLSRDAGSFATDDAAADDETGAESEDEDDDLDGEGDDDDDPLAWLTYTQLPGEDWSSDDDDWDTLKAEAKADDGEGETDAAEEGHP